MTWDELAIGDFCRTGSGGTPSRKKDSMYFGGNIPWVKSGELREGVITETEETITELAVIESSAKFIPKGALLVAMYGATIGRVAKLGIDATSNQAVCHILPDESLADMQYMFHALQAQVPHWLGKGVGGAQPNISQEIIKNTLIPLPPLEEQRRIAAILDKSYSIQGLLLQRHRMLQALINSMLISDFGSPTEWPLKWEMQKLGDCCECLDRYRRPVKESERQEGHIPYYGANGQQGWIDDFLFDESLVLVAEDGGHFADRRRGVAYRIDGKAWVNNHAHILRPRGNDLEIEFLHRILRHYDFVPYISGSTRSKLTQGQLNEVPIPVPPIDRQRSFSRCVERLVSSLGTSSRSLKAAESLSRSLAQSILESEK
jgi:type I restriction enzyme S subunit